MYDGQVLIANLSFFLCTMTIKILLHIGPLYKPVYLLSFGNILSLDIVPEYFTCTRNLKAVSVRHLRFSQDEIVHQPSFS